IVTTYYSFFFFFQAEDGIRDPLVTGVQTCALPIYVRRLRRALSDHARNPPPAAPRARRRGDRHRRALRLRVDPLRRDPPGVRSRSEERRVGKEWRVGWWAGGSKAARVEAEES